MSQLEEALAYLQANDIEKALQRFITYAEENPDDPVGFINAGNMLMQGKHHEQAENFFLKAIEKDDKAATAYYGLGNLYYTTHLYEQSELMFNKALGLGLTDSDVYFMIGMTHEKRDNHMLALPFLQRAKELDEHDTIKLLQYGLALAKLDYLQEAESVFQAVLQVEEQHVDAIYNLAVIEADNGKVLEANKRLDYVLKIAPNHQLAKKAKEYLEKERD